MMSTNDAPSASTAGGSGSNATVDVAALKAKIAILEAEVAAKANAIPVPEKTIVGIPVTTNVEESQLLIHNRLMVVCRLYTRRRGHHRCGIRRMWHPCYNKNPLAKMGMINKTAQGRGSQTIWTFCCSITTTSYEVTLTPRCDTRVRTRERRPLRQNISVAQFDIYTERVRQGFNNYLNLDFNGLIQKELSLHNNLPKQEIHGVVPKSIVDSIQLYRPMNQELARFAASQFQESNPVCYADAIYMRGFVLMQFLVDIDSTGHN